MGKITGFLDYNRKSNSYRNIQDRIKDFDELYVVNDENTRIEQAARCMNCGVPFCQYPLELNRAVTGCPLSNLIPEFNDEIYNKNYYHALERLLKTNCFPEFTGRVCPALCEKACINSIHSDAVTIKDNELFLIEYGFEKGYIKAANKKSLSDKKIAVIGSGPAGLACAEKLNKRGHNVTVFERDDRFGGLLMYGIPNMKLDKSIVERRINLMKEEGVKFIANANLGENLTYDYLNDEFDAVALCLGAKEPRRLSLPNSNVDGIFYAVDYLKNVTKNLLDGEKGLCFKDKNVVILGGGDTGNDCVATVIRQNAKSVKQLEITSKPSLTRDKSNPYPQWPRVFTTDYGQAEAVEVFSQDPRIFNTTIKEIIVKDGKLEKLLTVKVEFKDCKFVEIPQSEELLKVDVLLIATGFVGFEEYCTKGFKIPSKHDISFKTDKDKFFATGDMKRGQSLVVWAIHDGIKCAKEIDEYLFCN